MQGRTGVICCVAIVAAGLIQVPGASAATTLGRTQPDPFATCGPGDNVVQPFSSAFSYTVPAGGGVITGWAHVGRTASSPPTAGSGKLVIWRPTGDPSQFSVVGKSSSQAFTPSTRGDYPARISVQAGDVLGLRVESADVACWISNEISGRRAYNGPEPADGSTQTFGPEQSTQQVNVEATLEPDADLDGFGDETQDQCPGVLGTENGCPLPVSDPDTDGDGVPDSIDDCPAEPGPASNNGCPLGGTVLPPPVAGETANAENVTGSVRFKLPGSNQFIDLDDSANVPVGTLFDTTRGNVRLSSETAAGGIRQGEFSRGSFRFLQSEEDKFLTELKLTRAKGKGCKNRKPCKPNSVWGNGGGGHVTSGNNGSAGTRGTIWLTSEIRAGTRFKVIEGRIRVRDFGLDRTVTLTAGESYLARPR